LNYGHFPRNRECEGGDGHPRLEVQDPKSTKTTFQFGVGNPTKNWKVTLAGKVTAVPAGYKAGATGGTSFVPE
jgi:hypothetical protein